MGYCTWAGMNEANQIYHDPELTEFQYLVDGDNWTVSLK